MTCFMLKVASNKTQLVAVEKKRGITFQLPTSEKDILFLLGGSGGRGRLLK